jgi:adenylyl- and sulfurtransferase ThiI
MLIIADRIAQEMKAIGIVTGESLGDSGSMDTIVQASSDLNAPIYRPLVGFERNEIVELAKKASLYDESEYKTTPEVQRVSMQSFVNPIQNIRTQLETALTKKEIVPIAPMPYDE